MSTERRCLHITVCGVGEPEGRDGHRPRPHHPAGPRRHVTACTQQRPAENRDEQFVCLQSRSGWLTLPGRDRERDALWKLCRLVLEPRSGAGPAVGIQRLDTKAMSHHRKDRGPAHLRADQFGRLPEPRRSRRKLSELNAANTQERGATRPDGDRHTGPDSAAAGSPSTGRKALKAPPETVTRRLKSRALPGAPDRCSVVETQTPQPLGRRGPTASRRAKRNLAGQPDGHTPGNVPT